MSRKEAWFEPLVLKSTEVGKIEGGLSAVFGALLDTFWSDDAHDFSRAGIELDLADGSSMHLWARFEVLLSDEAALHAAYACKGAAGLKPCLVCMNVMNGRLQRDDVGAEAVLHSSSDYNALRYHTMASLRGIARRLDTVAGEGVKARLDETQTALGFNHCPAGILFREKWLSMAAPFAHAGFDWMHCYLVNGIFNHHTGLFLHAIRPLGIEPKALHEYITRWTWPKSIGSKTGIDVFGPKRFDSSWKEWSLRATASEGLSLVPVVGMFFQSVVENNSNHELTRHSACFLLLTRVIEMLMLANRSDPSHNCMHVQSWVIFQDANI